VSTVHTLLTPRIVDRGSVRDLTQRRSAPVR